MTQEEKGQAIFAAVGAIDELWREAERVNEIFDRRLSKLVASNNNLKIKRGIEDGSCEWLYTSYQYDWDIVQKPKRQPTRFLSLEFKMRTSDGNHVKTTGGEVLQIPTVFVKLATDDHFDLDQPNLSNSDEDEYESLGRVVWWSDSKNVYWVFAVPLLSLQDENDIVRELVAPLRLLLTATHKDKAKIDAAFSGCKATMRWVRDERGTHHVDLAVERTPGTDVSSTAGVAVS